MKYKIGDKFKDPSQGFRRSFKSGEIVAVLPNGKYVLDVIFHGDAGSGEDENLVARDENELDTFFELVEPGFEAGKTYHRKGADHGSRFLVIQELTGGADGEYLVRAEYSDGSLFHTVIRAESFPNMVEVFE